MDEESARTAICRILGAKIKEKPRDYSTAHFPIAANARTDELILWTILEIFRVQNQIIVEDYLTFPVNL